MDQLEMEFSKNNTSARLVITVTDGFGGLLFSVVLIALLCTRSYKTFLQRLFMWIIFYLGIVNFCQAASIAYRINAYTNNGTSIQDNICEFLAFFSMWFDWCAYIYCSILYSYLLFIVCRQSRDDSKIVTKIKNSKSLQVMLELGIVVGTLFAPVAVLWVPYYLRIYGFDGILCRFRPNTSRYYDFFAYTLAELTGIVAVVSCIGVGIIYCTMPRHMQNARRAVKKLVIVLLTLVVYKIVLTIMKVIPIILGVENSLAELAVINVFHTVVVSLVVLGYLLAFHFSKFCDPIMNLTKVKNEGNQQRHKNMEYRTFKYSSRESAPSSTFFSVPYTGQFTTVSNI